MDTSYKDIIHYGVNVDTRLDESKHTPLMIAANMNNMNAVRMLLKKGANIYAHATHKNALDLAIRSRHKDIQDYLRLVMRQQNEAEDIVLEEIRQERLNGLRDPIAIGYSRSVNEKLSLSSLPRDMMQLILRGSENTDVTVIPRRPR